MTVIEETILYLNSLTNSNYDPKDASVTKDLGTLCLRGYSFDDFKSVIDKKWSEWKGTEWQKYVRPHTLFGKKFEKYLYEKPRVGAKPIYKLAIAVRKAKQAYWRMDNDKRGK